MIKFLVASCACLLIITATRVDTGKSWIPQPIIEVDGKLAGLLIHVRRGRTVTLNCYIVNAPASDGPYNLVWIQPEGFDGSDTSSSSSSYSFDSLTNVTETLTLRNARRAHEGSWTCTATTWSKTRSSSTFLRIDEIGNESAFGSAAKMEQGYLLLLAASMSCRFLVGLRG